MTAVPLPPGYDASNAPNDEAIEAQWSLKAVQQMMTYWQLLNGIPGSKLKLTKIDDEIHSHFKEHFPDFDPSIPINEDEMKSKEGKEKWRAFISKYKDEVSDYNFGTMLRISPKTEYEEADTIFAVRMQFYAVEIARNRAGLNDWIYEQNQQSKS